MGSLPTAGTAGIPILGGASGLGFRVGGVLRSFGSQVSTLGSYVGLLTRSGGRAYEPNPPNAKIGALRILGPLILYS